MRLFISCSELGLGHVSRIIPLGKLLAERGHELIFFSGGIAYQLLSREFENVHPCTPVAWYESSFGVIASASVLNILFPLPRYNYENDRLEIKSSNTAETIHRYYDLRRHILRIKPEIVIADGDMHALRLAHRWRIPSVYITNVIRPSYRFSSLLIPGERFTERYVKKCNRIIVPDNPKNTLCEYSIGDIDHIGIRNKIEFVGSFRDMTSERGLENHIFASISGPLGTRAKLARMIIPILLRLKTKSIVSLGNPNNKAARKHGNCEIYNWLNREQRDYYMKNAEIVIFSGGHGTCFEVIKYGKPSICIPTQPEQMGNARKMQELKCSISVEKKTQLRPAILEIERKRELYKKNVGKMREYCRKFEGVKNAAQEIENIL
jgi:uncharacterized protein (TIGR00661 family)